MKYSQKRRKIKLQEGVQIDSIKLKMCGFPQTREPPSCGDHWYEPLNGGVDEALGGVTAKGGKGDDMPPMNSRGG